MKMKYGEFTNEQLYFFIKRIRKTIFLLLLAVDKATQINNEHVDVEKTFDGVLLELGGATSLFPDRAEFVDVINYLERARIEYLSDNFHFATYRKLILDAGSRMLSLEDELKYS